MRLFVMLFALAAIIMFFALALKRGTENRKDIMEIEKKERRTTGETGENAEEEPSVGLGSFSSIKNTVGKTLKCLGIIILFAGTIISLCLAQTENADFYSIQFGFSFLLFFTCELITCAAGFLFIGLGEIIKLLTDISISLRKI